MSIPSYSKLFFSEPSTHRLANSSSNSLYLLTNFSNFFKNVPQDFIITTRSGSSNFNTDFLAETSITIWKFIKENHHEYKFHLDIEDPRNVLGKFEQLYQGQQVIFEPEDFQASYEITEKLSIFCCPNYLKPAKFEDLDDSSFDTNDSYDLNSGVIINGLSQFLKNSKFQTFTIITNKNKYKCNIFGVYCSNTIRNQIQKDPTKKEYVYNFEDENNEFQLICKLFNFEKIEITNENVEILKVMLTDLQIQDLFEPIKKYEKVARIIDDQQAKIDSINELFEWLYSIKEKTVKTVANLIIQSSWIQTEGSVQELAAFFIEVVHTDNILSTYLVELLIELNEQSVNNEHLKILLPFVIIKIIEFYDRKNISSFIYKLYKKGYITVNQITKKLWHYCFDNIDVNNWLSPILIKNDIDNYFKNNLQSEINSITIGCIKSYFPDKIDIYEQILDAGEPNDWILKSLRNDDIDEFQSIIAKKEQKNNFKIERNPFDDLPFYYNLKNINYAAAFGSLKCFKYLLMNHYEIDENTFKFAIFGGNVEIIKIVDQRNKENKSEYDYYDELVYLIKKHRNDIFDWVLEKGHKNNSKKQIYKLIKISAKHGNAHSLTELIYKGIDNNNNNIDDEDEEDLFKEIVEKCASNGFYKLIKILLKIVKEKGLDIKFSFFAHINFGSLPIFKLLLDKSQINKSLRTAIQHNYKSIAKYCLEELIEDIDIDDEFVSFCLEDSLENADCEFFEYLIEKFKEIYPDYCVEYDQLLPEDCRHINFDCVKLITNIILNENQKYDFTNAFQIAAEKGSNEICQFFIDKKVKIKYLHSKSYGLLNERIFSFIHNKMKPEDKKRMLKSLEQAILNKNVKLIEYLFQQNAICFNALNLAVKTNDFSFVKVILKYYRCNGNANFLINCLESKGTALTLAVRNNNIKIIKLLLTIPEINPSLCNLNDKKEIECPLLIAIRENNLEIIDCILDFYGDEIQYEKQQLELIMKEIFEIYTKYRNKSKYLNVINRILDIKYIDPNYLYCYTRRYYYDDYNESEYEYQDYDDDDDDDEYYENNHIKFCETFLIKACRNNDIQIVKKLLNFNNIDVNKYSLTTGDSPLLVAIKNGNVKIINLLLDHPNIDINHKNFDNKVAILLAFENKNLMSVVKSLLKLYNIDLYEFKSILKGNSHEEISKFLLPIQNAKPRDKQGVIHEKNLLLILLLILILICLTYF
ncbi:hypothetical protein M9Y10_032718 [Tritrichomonas musculus]|uniref:DUF3447 domain-containing protein n=1 Tax=Tritrichomonas musculus TaxID=1915356 RepID=A0ABR2GXM8_9EUKA